MTGKMDKDYFDQKKEYATDGLVNVGKIAMDVVDLIRSFNYEMPDLVEPNAIHDQLQLAKSLLDNARRDFEKVRWASAKTELEFNDWLISNGHTDLVTG